MKLTIIAVLFVVAVSGKPSPVTHTLEVSPTGAVGSSIYSPFVSLIINISNGLSDLVSVVGLPSETPAIVETPIQPPPLIPGPVIPGPVIPGPVIPGPVVPGPVIPENPIVVDVPIVPEPIVIPEVNPEPIVVEPTPVVPEPNPVIPEPIVIPGVAPEPVIVVDQPTPVDPVTVVETPESPLPAPAGLDTQESTGVTNNFFINVLLNFFTGSDGRPTVTSGLPDISSLPRGLQQLFGANAA